MNCRRRSDRESSRSVARREREIVLGDAVQHAGFAAGVDGLDDVGVVHEQVSRPARIHPSYTGCGVIRRAQWEVWLDAAIDAVGAGASHGAPRQRHGRPCGADVRSRSKLGLRTGQLIPIARSQPIAIADPDARPGGLAAGTLELIAGRELRAAAAAEDALGDRVAGRERRHA